MLIRKGDTAPITEEFTFSKISSFLCAIGSFQASSHFMEKSKQLMRSFLSFLELYRARIKLKLEEACVKPVRADAQSLAEE